MLQSVWELCLSQLITFKTHILLAVLSVLFFRLVRSRRLSPKNLPPGPWGLPFFGYLPFLSKYEPHLQLENLRQKYGDIFGLYLGSKYAVFIGEIVKAKEALNLEELSGRPDGAFPLTVTNTHFAALNGNGWKERRKCAAQALRQLGIGTHMIQDVSRKEINVAVEGLKEEIGSSSSGKDVNVRPILIYSTLTVILQFVCGKVFSSDHHSYKVVAKFLKFFAENGSNISLDMVLPWARPILALTSYIKDTKKIITDMETIVRAEVENHLKSCPDNPKDMIDFFVKHYMYKFQSSSEIPIDDICGDAQAMIFGGSVTVRVTIEWFVLCMAAHTEIQEKVFREIDSVLGSSGEVHYENRHLLPYSEAAILESFRYKTLGPINPYHSALQDTTFDGYNIPKDSLVFVLLWSLHNDPAYWNHPEEFHPEHFLTSDMSKVKVPDAFQPFAPGKRTCPGDKVALIETYLYCITLIQHFKILPPDGGVKLDGKFCLNLEPIYSTVKFVTRRKSSN